MKESQREEPKKELGQANVTPKNDEKGATPAPTVESAKARVNHHRRMFAYAICSVLVTAILIVCACIFRDWASANYQYIFLFLSLASLAYGIYRFQHQGVEVSHFSGFAIRPTSGRSIVTEAGVIGQYKTKGEGFLVGKKINVSGLVYLRNVETYQQFKATFKEPGVVTVENSEDAEASERDISKVIESGDMTDVFTNPGILRIKRFNDDKTTFVFEGDVVFTKEGEIAFGPPISAILRNYGIRIKGVNIAPSYIRHELYWTRVVVFLTFVTIAVAFLSLFLGIQG